MTANAMRHKTNTRPDDGQRPPTKHQTVMREEYAKIAARPKGQYHFFVRACTCLSPPFFRRDISDFPHIDHHRVWLSPFPELRLTRTSPARSGSACQGFFGRMTGLRCVPSQVRRLLRRGIPGISAPVGHAWHDGTSRVSVTGNTILRHTSQAGTDAGTTTRG